MPVNDRDAAWAEHEADRQKVADLFAGKASAIQYVRALPGWDPAALKLIQENAYFLPIVARTVETFGGLVFLKAPTRTVPENLTPLLDDVTQTGQEIDRFAEQAADAVMMTGAVMVLDDYPRSDVSMTKAEAERIGRRPVMRQYDANSILAARKTLIQGVLKLTHVRVLETVEEQDPADAFRMKNVQTVRVLELTDGVYTQTVWRLGEGGWTQGETITPLKNGEPLDHIPAYFSNTRDGEARPAKPPMADLAQISIEHLNNSAQYEWALAWLGSPILFGAGITLGEGETIQMGASSAVLAPDATAKLEIVQADAAKFSGLKTAMDDKRRDAAAMGARMLLEPTRAQISAETARIERAGETSVVGSMANALSQCLTNAIRFLAEWADISGAEKALYWLNAALPSRLSAQEVTSLVEAWIKGALTEAELYAKLQEGEVIDPAKTFEKHLEEKAAEIPDPDDEAAMEAALGGQTSAQDQAADQSLAEAGVA